MGATWQCSALHTRPLPSPVAYAHCYLVSYLSSLARISSISYVRIASAVTSAGRTRGRRDARACQHALMNARSAVVWSLAGWICCCCCSPATPGIFLDQASCSEVFSNQRGVLGQGKTKEVLASSLRGESVVMKRLKDRHKPDMHGYFDLFREATLLWEVNSLHRQSAVQVYGICRTEHMLSDFVVIQRLETLKPPDPFSVTANPFTNQLPSISGHANVQWSNEYDKTPFGALSKNLSATRAQLHILFQQLATLPSGAIGLHDLSWGQFGVLPSGVLAVLDLGCVRFGGRVDDVMLRARHLTDRLAHSAVEERAKAEAAWAARAMGTNSTVLAKAESRAHRALHGDGAVIAGGGNATDHAQAHLTGNIFGENSCIGW